MVRRLFALLVLITAAPAAAAVSGLAPWMELTLPGRAANQFAAPAPGTVTVRSADSVSFLYRPVSGDEGTARRLRWSWRVDAQPPPADLAAAGRDDRPLAVHVWFQRDGRTLSGLLSGLAGFPQGRLITYAWGGIQAPGTVLVSPGLGGDGRVIVLRGGDAPLGRWIDEAVDLDGDYARLFGVPMPPPTHVAISADTDDMGGVSRGAVRGLAFGGARP
ncbi:MAG: DUF3047 domain-containing protein [Rhodobacterales bacterium]|nr:DUF3047 domain-containing protein [Rhodobacterales bacterium]